MDTVIGSDRPIDKAFQASARVRSAIRSARAAGDDPESKPEGGIRLPDALRFALPSRGVPVSPTTTREIGLQQMNVGQAIPEFSHLFAVLERRIATRLADRGTVITSPSIPGFRRLGGPGGGRAAYKQPCIVGVTSAVPQEGKTTVALHLAASAARDTYKSVALIDMGMSEDLCRSLNIALADGVSLMDCLEGMDETIPTMRLADSQNLFLLPAGRPPKSAARTARSPRVGELLDSARQAFDIVIVDLPAIGTDNAMPIIDHVDGVVMVTRTGVTPHRVVQRALEEVGKDKILGVVLNQAPTSSIPRGIQKRLFR